MSENLLLHRRPAPQQRAVPSSVAQPRPAVWAQPVVADADAAQPVATRPHPAVVDRAHPSGTNRPDAAIPAERELAFAARSRSTLAAESAFAARNSPVDLLFRGLWQLVGVYVYLVLVVKDRKLPR